MVLWQYLSFVRTPSSVSGLRRHGQWSLRTRETGPTVTLRTVDRVEKALGCQGMVDPQLQGLPKPYLTKILKEVETVPVRGGIGVS